MSTPSNGVEGYMDLSLHVLITAKGYWRTALSYYWKHNSGEMIPDLDMEIGVYQDWEMAEVLTYQDMYRYDDVYSGPDGQAYRRYYLHCNAFLEKWLEALAEQGHLLRKCGENYGLSLCL